MSRFWHLFEPDQAESDMIRASLNDAHEVLNFAQHAHFEKFMGWLRAEWERPKVINDHVKLIEQVARENTLKEVYHHLNSQIEQARRLLANQREN